MLPVPKVNGTFKAEKKGCQHNKKRNGPPQNREASKDQEKEGALKREKKGRVKRLLFEKTFKQGAEKTDKGPGK